MGVVGPAARPHAFWRFESVIWAPGWSLTSFVTMYLLFGAKALPAPAGWAATAAPETRPAAKPMVTSAFPTRIHPIRASLVRCVLRIASPPSAVPHAPCRSDYGPASSRVHGARRSIGSSDETRDRRARRGPRHPLRRIETTRAARPGW